MDLVNKQTGKVENVPDEKAEEAFKSGAYSFSKGQQVPVTNPDGKLGTIPAEQINKALSQGYSFSSHKAIEEAENEAKYGGMGGALKAAGAGALRGLTFGLSDRFIGEGRAALKSNLGEAEQTEQETREALKGLKETNPGSTVAGEVGGALGGTFLGGGLGEAIGAVPKAISGAGGLIEHGVEHLVGEGAKGLAGKMAQHALALGAGSAAEGALYGASNEISESYLNNQQLTGEKLLASMGHGALIAGGVGGILGAASPLIEKAAAKASETIRPVAKEILGADNLEELAGQNAFKALRPTAKFVSKAERTEGGVSGVGRRAMEAVEEETGTPFAKVTPTERVEALSNATQKAGSRVEELYGALDEAVAKEGGEVARPTVDSLVSRIENDIIAPLKKTPGRRDIVNKLDSYLEDIRAAVPEGEDLTFKKLWDFRRAVDDNINYERNPLGTHATPGEKAFKQVRSVIADELMSSAERAGKFAGEDFVSQLKAANKDYAQLSVANQTVQKTAQLDVSRRVMSPSDYGVGIGTGMAAIAAGHPLGALAGIGTALVNRAGRLYGRAAIADALDAMAHSNLIQQIAGTVDGKIHKTLTHFFSTGLEEATKAEGAGLIGGLKAVSNEGSLREQYEKRAGDLRTALANPSAVLEHMSKVVEPIAKTQPQVASSMLSTATRGTQYLESKLPNDMEAGGLIPVKKQPSDLDMSKFVTASRVIDDPSIMLEHMKEGKISRDEVDAVKAVYPEIYKDIQSKVMQELSNMAAKDKTLPYDKVIQLGILLDIPADKTLRPDFIQSMQRNFAGSASPQRGPSASRGAPKRMVNIASGTSTEIESVAGGAH